MGIIKGGIQKFPFRTRRHELQKAYLENIGLSERGALDRFIERKRNDLFLHAYEHNRYYHQAFKQIGLILNGEVDSSRIADISVLKKDIIRKNQHELISDDYYTREWSYNSSGGSTGELGGLMQDDIYLRWQNTTYHRCYKNMLALEGATAKKVILWGSKRGIFQGSVGLKAKLQNWISNTVFLNSPRMIEERCVVWFSSTCTLSDNFTSQNLQ